MNPLFSDTETTGFGKHDRLLQIACKGGGFTACELFKPPAPISQGAMDIHGISSGDVNRKTPFVGSPLHGILRRLQVRMTFVAHNAAFDLRMLAKEGIVFASFIDTVKIQKHLGLPDGCASHKLGDLRDAYGIQVEGEAHDALVDVLVLEKLFEIHMHEFLTRLKFQSEGEAIGRMIEISKPKK